MRLNTIHQILESGRHHFEDGSFEEQMFRLASNRSGQDIREPESLGNMIKWIEQDLHTLSRFKAGRMTLGHFKSKRVFTKLAPETEQFFRDTLEKLKEYTPSKSTNEAKYNPIRTPDPDEPYSYKIIGYHTTLIDRWPSIKQKGLIPGASEPGGQDWKGKYTGTGVYFHQELPMHEIGVSTDGGDLITITIEARFIIGAGYVVLDEEAGMPEDTPEVMKQKGPIAVAIRIPPNDIKALHLKDDEISRDWVKNNKKLVAGKEVVYHK